MPLQFVYENRFRDDTFGASFLFSEQTKHEKTKLPLYICIVNSKGKKIKARVVFSCFFYSGNTIFTLKTTFFFNFINAFLFSC